jgi:molecular chaperone GrpE
MTWKIYRQPADTAGSEPDDTPDQEKTSEEITSAPPPDPIAELQAELAAAKSESESWRDRFLRKAAEFENYRRRTDKEKADSMVLAKSSVLIEFLPVVDACERALSSFKSTQGPKEGLEEYRLGVELLYKQVLDTLHRLGVVPIEAEGRGFDPNLHEALIREATSKHKENTVIEELRRGYLFKDRLLRPAQVKVASRPSGEGPAKS